MTSQPDKLFRDKLENFQQPAPLGAWDRIESKLARPAYKLIWVRVAAGVALLTAAAILLWPAEKAEQQIVKTNEQNSVKPTDTLQKQSGKKEEQLLNSDKTVTPLQALQTETVRTSKNQLPVEKSDRSVQDSVLIPVVEPTKELIAEVAPSLEKDHSKTIVYTADEVNARFLKKKLPPQATPDTKEASGIQRLIGLAYDAKNSEAPLGDLRQKKDDILALNFGKKKGVN